MNTIERCLSLCLSVVRSVCFTKLLKILSRFAVPLLVLLCVSGPAAAQAARVRIGSHPATVRKTVMSVLERLGIAAYHQNVAGEMSYGHQRLLEIAMGLSQSPELFIMDEPTQGLSAPEIEHYKSLVKDLAGDTTILLIEHNMDVVMSTAVQITVLNQGALLASGAPADIQSNADVQAAYLGTERVEESV